MKKIFEKTVFPNAKLNLYLEITGKRSDGYHLLDTVMVPITLHDQLDITLYDQGDIVVETIGEEISSEENLVTRIAQKYRELFQLNFGMRAVLRKKIPTGAGLGGGSSDAAFCLKVLNNHFQCAKIEELIKIAATLGADIPFFLINRPAFCQGIGDEIYPVDLPEMNFTLFIPDHHCNTGKIFQKMKKFLTPDEIFGKTLIPDRVIWKQLAATHKTFFNKLEKVVLLSDPFLEDFKRKLESLTGRLVFMTGSGCTFYTEGKIKADLENGRVIKIQLFDIGASSSG